MRFRGLLGSPIIPGLRLAAWGTHTHSGDADQRTKTESRNKRGPEEGRGSCVWRRRYPSVVHLAEKWLARHPAVLDTVGHTALFDTDFFTPRHRDHFVV